MKEAPPLWSVLILLMLLRLKVLELIESEGDIQALEL